MIQIRTTDRGYSASVSPPDVLFNYRTPHSMGAQELVGELTLQGVRSTAIIGALYAADPTWNAGRPIPNWANITPPGLSPAALAG